MNPQDRYLERLLEAAQDACPAIPSPSPWFEQRLLQALRAETNPFAAFLDSTLLFRLFGLAMVVMIVSVILPAFQVMSPYADTLELANSTVQMEMR